LSNVPDSVSDNRLSDPEVRCYSGHTYAERPESFRWKGAEYLVTRIEKSWKEPGGKCFRVSTGDNKRFRLCYNVANDKWSVTALVRS